MGVDIMDNKTPFREMEIPKELLENILLIPAYYDPCPYAPIVKIERKLSFEQVKEMMAQDEAICQQLGVDTIDRFDHPRFKASLIRKDMALLSEMVATNFYSKIRNQKFDWANLYQMVEIDWTIRDFCPGARAMHYEVFTKREILIRAEAKADEQKEA